MEDTERPEPKIYVADLAAYNIGELHGRWIELMSDTTVDAVRSAITAMLRESPTLPDHLPEEYTIHDYEGFHGYELEEHEELDTVVKVAAFITEHGELGAKLINHSYDVDEARGFLEDQYADVIARNAFLNVVIHRGKVASIKAKEPFASMMEGRESSPGGHGRT